MQFRTSIRSPWRLEQNTSRLIPVFVSLTHFERIVERACTCRILLVVALRDRTAVMSISVEALIWTLTSISELGHRTV